VLILKPDNFRPISLLSCLSKVMEKMIYNRLQWHIESQHIIPDYQFGFRPDRSCIDCLVILSSEIHKSFINQSVTIGAFLDIKGAFDNVVPNILIQDLEDTGIPARIGMFVYNLISSRSLHFVVEGNKIGPFLAYKGTPQESTLSPLLFDIYLRKITSCIHHNTRIILYTDDITIYSTSSNPIVAFQSIQKSLDGISEFFKYRGLEVFPLRKLSG